MQTYGNFLISKSFSGFFMQYYSDINYIYAKKKIVIGYI
jgi:hypothetical protein